jgi:hypothetical protein
VLSAARQCLTECFPRGRLFSDNGFHRLTIAKGNVPARRSRVKRCSFEPPRKFSRVDDDPGMRTGPDLLVTVGCSDGELDLPPVDFRHLGLPGDQASDRRRCEMAHVDRRADRAVSVSPGAIALNLMRYRASSRAIARVSEGMPPSLAT